MNIGQALKAFQERLDDSMISFVCLDTARCSHFWLSCRCYSVYFTACKPSPWTEQSKESTRIQTKEEGTAGLPPIEHAAFHLLSEVGLIAQPFLVMRFLEKSTLCFFLYLRTLQRLAKFYYWNLVINYCNYFIIAIFGVKFVFKNTINFYWTEFNILFTFSKKLSAN